MNPIGATPYPLVWPPGWPRTQYRGYAPHRIDSISIPEARDRLCDELERLRATKVIISTNLPLNTRGEPAGNAANPSDPGVAVYFYRKGIQLCFPRDQYAKVAVNLWSLAKGIEYLRGLERHGGAHMMERAFSGFVAAIEMKVRREWREVLDAAGAVSLMEAQACYRSAAFKCHPDQGGSNEAMAEVNEAWEQAQRELGNA